MDVSRQKEARQLIDKLEGTRLRLTHLRELGRPAAVSFVAPNYGQVSIPYDCGGEIILAAADLGLRYVIADLCARLEALGVTGVRLAGDAPSES